MRRQVDNAEFQSILTTDPAKIMRDVRQPILIVQGELDTQVTPSNADVLEKLARERKKWMKGMNEWRARNASLSEQWDIYWSHRLPDGYESALLESSKSEKPIATRAYSGQVIQGLAAIAPFVVGGSADLAPSTSTLIKNGGSVERSADDRHDPPKFDVFKSRNLHSGIREHSMGAIINGMTLYGSWRAYGATFLIFSDYMRASVRLACLMNIPSIFVYTHDSVFLGEDGPTHQPVEHLAALRAIPNLHVFRPSDTVETIECWQLALENRDGPSILALTRQAA